MSTSDHETDHETDSEIPCGVCGDLHMRCAMSPTNAACVRGGLVCSWCEELLAEEYADDGDDGVYGAKELCERGWV